MQSAVVDHFSDRGLVGIPTLEEIGGLNASNEIELGEQIRTVLRLMKPQRALGQRKARFGRPNDGGYTHLDDFSGVNVALSLGIRDDISWDLDAANRGLRIYQFDHTVDDPAPEDHRMVFSKTMIAAQPATGCTTLESLVHEHDKGLAKPNIFLKMDIEDSEWSVIEATPQEHLGRFTQITCEMHGFENFVRSEWRQGFYRALRKLSLNYAPVHVHANNFADFGVIAGVPVANVLEVSWANRAVYDLVDTDETFPGPLDMPCWSGGPDHYLGSFRY
ncbi:FkbM family methyltransferase [Sphingomonas sp.]|uniref:FkbM family methyltransferase n=1 Tax=Sphingomonas sp. TaxID=28214 RepID=UPI000DB16045|nr:FkbM family methyltransferase [Sphingomonas sp.]PZU10039.1 MAG: hypothetical protein DI605_05410 [Sphingomonas sp.]